MALTNECHLNCLVTVQKRVIRTIADASFIAHSTPIFHQLKLLKLHDIYKFNAVVDTHLKIMNGNYHVLHNVNTRNRNLALPKFHRLARTQQSVSFNGPSYWNDLPLSIREKTNIAHFKRDLKAFYIDQYETD